MLEKIIDIKNIGCLNNCKSIGDVTFRKISLVYAENGQGKTTLCAILRSLQSGSPEFITERKTLGTEDVTSTVLRLNGKNYRFLSDKWNDVYPNIQIFDSVFVHENVYSGDYVEHEHKKNLYRVIVGSAGVKLAKKVDHFDAEIRKVNQSIRFKKKEIENFLQGEMSLPKFLELKLDTDIEVKIKMKSDELSNQQKAIDKSDEIKNKDQLTEVILPSLSPDLKEILSKELNNITEEAEAKVRQQILDCLDDDGEGWLAQGTKYIKDHQCPFCGENIGDNTLIECYLNYFNEEYNALKKEVALLSSQLDNTIGNSILMSIQQKLTTNQTLTEFWRQFIRSYPKIKSRLLQ